MTIRAWAALTDVGREREHNEDSVLAEPPVFGVADGVGGANAGEVASQIALARAREAIPETSGLSIEQISDAVEAAIVAANASVRREQGERVGASGMATTLTLAVIATPRTAVLGHVGDSRAYMVQPSRITQLTSDHSFVAELVRSGQLSVEDAADHPQRNVITRALGAADQVDVDVQRVSIPSDGTLVLCSDGLTNHVSDDEILVIIGEAADADDAARKLVAAANADGGSDNISVVLIRTSGEGEPDAHRNPAEDTSGNLVLEGLHAPGDDRGAAQALAGRSTPPVDVRELAQAPTHVDAAPLAPAPSTRSGFRWRIAAITFASIAVVAVGIAWLWSNTYVVVERSNGTIGIDQGFPLDGLHVEHISTDIAVSSLDPADRERLLDGSPRSLENARALIADYEGGE